MGVIGFGFLLYIFAAEFVFGLRSAEQVGGQFGAAHVVQNLLALLQPFAGMNTFGIESAIKPFVAVVLEDGKIQIRLHTRLLRSFHQLFIVLFHLVTQK